MKRTSQVRAFGGLDERRVFSEDLTYAVDMRNFQITENHTLRKRYGLTTVFHANGNVTGMWSGYLGVKRFLLYIAGGELYGKASGEDGFTCYGYVGTDKSVMFEFQRYVYIKNQKNYYRFDGELITYVNGYVPTVAIGCAPDGAGSTFEDINMLSSRRKVKYSCDGTSVQYQLPEKNIASVELVRIDGENQSQSGYRLDLQAGTLTFAQAPAKGVNNLLVQYDVGYDRSRVVLGASGVMLFGGDTDGHVFLWGNPSYPGYRFHSELADGQPSAEYFPENNYTIIGDSEITDIISQYDRQLIFTKDRAYYSYCELQRDTFGNVYASFPVYNLNGEKGSLLKNAGCIVNNEPITLCADGLNRWTSTAVENEKNAVCFSHAVAGTLSSFLKRDSLDGMRLFNVRATGELFCICGETALIYNYRIGAWYAYDNFAADCMVEYDGKLYFSRGECILCPDETASSDDGTRVNAYWETPYVYTMSGGKKGRVHRMYYTARVSGAPEWNISYDGSTSQTELRLTVGEQATVSGSFRVPVFGSALIKFRLTECDDAFCEISEWRMLAGQKGQYGRKGV